MEKVIDLRKSVYDICQAYPDAAAICRWASRNRQPGMLTGTHHDDSLARGCGIAGRRLLC